MKVPKFLSWIDQYLEEAIMVIFLILISVIMMLQIAYRTITGNAMPWPEEFCRYCFIWSCMIATGYCIRKGSMLRVDVVINLFPKKIAAVLDIFSKILAVIFCIILLAPAWKVMMSSYDIAQTSSAMRIPMWWIYISAPLGFLSGIIRGVQSVIITIMEVKKGESVEGGECA